MDFFYIFSKIKNYIIDQEEDITIKSTDFHLVLLSIFLSTWENT